MVAEVEGEVVGVCLLSDAGCSMGHVASMRESFDIDAYWTPPTLTPGIGSHGCVRAWRVVLRPRVVG